MADDGRGEDGGRTSPGRRPVHRLPTPPDLGLPPVQRIEGLSRARLPRYPAAAAAWHGSPDPWRPLGIPSPLFTGRETRATEDTTAGPQSEGVGPLHVSSVFGGGSR